MSVRVYSSLDDLSADDIDRLSYRNQKNVFNSVEWFRCLIAQNIFEGKETRIYVTDGGDAANGWCYLFMVADVSKRTLSSMTNFYTMEFSPICAEEKSPSPAQLSELFEYIAAESPRWKSIELRLLYEGIAGTTHIQRAISGAGFYASPYFIFENYFAALDGSSFADYYALRSSRVKNTIKRREKKLAKTHEFSIRILRDFDAVAIADYTAVYDKSWKESEQFPGFIRELCGLCASLGVLRMGILYADGMPVAAQLWILSGRKALIYKLAYDEAFKEFSVGSILTRDMLEHVLENDDVDEIDYGVGSENYKKDWMDQTRKLIGLEAFNRRTLGGMIRIYKNRIARFLKPSAV